MKKKYLFLVVAIVLGGFSFYYFNTTSVNSEHTNVVYEIKSHIKEKRTKKTREEASAFTIERLQHEINLQKNPLTGEIPLEEKQQELQNALEAKLLAKFSRNSSNTYVSRGPTNLGGRTRAVKVDLSDNTGNTMLAGGVSSGLFRTTDGGANWVKVSPNDEIHNVTALVQDPRVGHQNVWYYGTGEISGNSASLGSAFLGQGVWKSTDGGLTWAVISQTNSTYTSFDTHFDFTANLKVHPTTGDLFIASSGTISRFDGATMVTELQEAGNGWTDIEIAADGTVYATLDSSDFTVNGVWQSNTNGNGSWTRIASNLATPSGWSASGSGRIVLAAAPSNANILYALYDNGSQGGLESDLWRFNAVTSTWTDLSAKLPDEPGGDLAGNDPFAIQFGYDLVMAVKPNDENFVLIGGTNAYKINNINTDPMFERIGGYASNTTYGLYNFGGVEHHPDLHAFEFNPFDTTFKTVLTGSDGGVHQTIDIDAANVAWQNLNNNYQTYQFYHVAMDPTQGSDFVMGGAQDNGTVVGGLSASLPNSTEMTRVLSGDGVAVGIAPRTGNIQLYAGVQNGRIFKINPGFLEITPQNIFSQFVTYFYLDPENTNALYYAGIKNIAQSGTNFAGTILRTNDAENVTASNWVDLGNLPSQEFITTYATTPGTYNPSTSQLFIGGNEGGVFRLNNPQNATTALGATNITPTGATVANGVIVSDIAIHPTNPDIMLVTYSNYGINNIFLTTNATATTPTWTLVERNLNLHSVRSAAITEVNGVTNYFVGTARGLYRTEDPTTTDWTLEGENQIGLAVVSGLVYRHNDNKLLVGTHGNGMFETTVQQLSTNSFDKADVALKVFPNPTTNNLQLTGKTINLNQTIPFEIYDSNGRQVNKGETLNGKINTSNLSNGFYILSVTINNQAQTIKFIKK